MALRVEFCDLRPSLAGTGRSSDGERKLQCRSSAARPGMGDRHEQCIVLGPAMPHRTPIPHQLNAARGCVVGKTEVQSLWRHRGATPQGLPETPKDAAPISQSRARRSRAVALARTPAVSEIEVPESFEIESSNEHAPEIQDPNGHAPEMPEPGNPEPDEPGPDVPEPEVPEVPEPEPEHPTSTN
jgi:hypothetical protein